MKTALARKWGTAAYWDDRVHEAESASWARVVSTAGAAVWAVMAVLARMGIARIGAIELMFLFAPLVIVPLGMELMRVMGAGGWLESVARRLQPLGAVCAVVAMWMGPGRRAGVVALGWMVVCAVMALGGLVDLVGVTGRVAKVKTPTRSLQKTEGQGWGTLADRSVRATLAIARIDLAVGGAWLVASRMGLRVMGIQEPIGLLTAVHFHFAGFATATIAAATLAFAERRGMHRWLRYLVPFVVGLPYAVAVGFVVSPGLKMAAAVLFSASVATLAISVRACGQWVEVGAGRVLLQVASAAVFAGVVLSGAYAVSDFLKSDALTIPQMARTHGILNGVGFCMAGLLGWLVSSES